MHRGRLFEDDGEELRLDDVSGSDSAWSFAYDVTQAVATLNRKASNVDFIKALADVIEAVGAAAGEFAKEIHDAALDRRLDPSTELESLGKLLKSTASKSNDVEIRRVLSYVMKSEG